MTSGEAIPANRKRLCPQRPRGGRRSRRRAFSASGSALGSSRSPSGSPPGVKSTPHPRSSPFSRACSQSRLASWRQQHASPTPEPFQPGLLPGDFSATVVVEGFNVGVIGLNSAFQTMAPAKGSHEVRVDQLLAVTRGEVRSWAQARLPGAVDPCPTHPAGSHAPASVLEKLMLPDLPFLHLCGSRNLEGWIETPTAFQWPRAIQAPSSLWRDARGGRRVGILRRAARH